MTIARYAQNQAPESCEGRPDGRDPNLSPLSQPSTQHFAQEHTEPEPKPRDSLTPVRCTQTNPSWELDDEELTVHSDEEALGLDMSVKHARKRPADSTESRD
jgi:hypothetical protein